MSSWFGKLKSGVTSLNIKSTSENDAIYYRNGNILNKEDLNETKHSCMLYLDCQTMKDLIYTILIYINDFKKRSTDSQKNALIELKQNVNKLRGVNANDIDRNIYNIMTKYHTHIKHVLNPSYIDLEILARPQGDQGDQTQYQDNQDDQNQNNGNQLKQLKGKIVEGIFNLTNIKPTTVILKSIDVKRKTITVYKPSTSVLSKKISSKLQYYTIQIKDICTSGSSRNNQGTNDESGDATGQCNIGEIKSIYETNKDESQSVGEGEGERNNNYDEDN
jgi:hypothetical protein